MIKIVLALLLNLYIPWVTAVTLNDLPDVGELSLNARILGTLDQGQSSGDFDLIWRETQRDVTAGGDSVIAGYFYANRNNVSWGSSSNPEVYVKVWFAQSGILNLNFFHVGLFDIGISSSFEARNPNIVGGRADDNSRISIEQDQWRYVRHDYCWGNACFTDLPISNDANCDNLNDNDYNFCQTERLLGSWDLTYSIVSEFTDTLTFNGGLESQSNGSYNTVGTNQFEQIAVGGYSNVNQQFLIQIRGTDFSDVYLFDLVDNNHAEGCHYLVANNDIDNLANCNTLTGLRLNNRRTAKAAPTENLTVRTHRKQAEQLFIHKK